MTRNNDNSWMGLALAGLTVWILFLGGWSTLQAIQKTIEAGAQRIQSTPAVVVQPIGTAIITTPAQPIIIPTAQPQAPVVQVVATTQPVVIVVTPTPAPVIAPSTPPPAGVTIHVGPDGASVSIQNAPQAPALPAPGQPGFTESFKEPPTLPAGNPFVGCLPGRNCSPNAPTAALPAPGEPGFVESFK